VEGRSVLLAVETLFRLNESEVQGTWSHTRPSGARTTLVTFTKSSTITDMTRRDRLLFRGPNASLQLLALPFCPESPRYLLMDRGDEEACEEGTVS
jgi:hypothetical protein